jgi:hypothetical protein
MDRCDGEELVHVSVVDCIDVLEDVPEFAEPASPGQPRTSVKPANLSYLQ